MVSAGSGRASQLTATGDGPALELICRLSPKHVAGTSCVQQERPRPGAVVRRLLMVQTLLATRAPPQDKPSLVVWQTGTADAINGVEPDDFHASLDSGVEKMQTAGADVILMNMQYSPRTASMLDVTPYADVMRLVAQQRNALLFDRLGIMKYWNDVGTFDLYAATKKYDMARRVHDCIGRALASQIINAAHLDPIRMQTTR